MSLVFEYKQVCLESVGFVLPSEVVTSDALEARLAPLYERLRLPPGRLALLSGIDQRRVWQPGTRPSDWSIRSARLALDAAEWPASRVGALLHGSVCRDYLEPATACRVHDRLGLPAASLVHDVSNACLGLLSGMLQIADQIELGRIEAGLVVGTENARPLLETTIDQLNRDTTLTRRTVKSAIASLTIGSASCAWLLVHARLSRTGNHLRRVVVHAATDQHRLCQSHQDQAGPGMQPLMSTDSEQLLEAGVAVGREAFTRFETAAGWDRASLDRTVCHQVGSTHRQRMLEAFGLDADRDHITYPWLGNTGSTALPVTLGDALLRGRIGAGDRVGLFGIGSGINCILIGVEWSQTRVLGQDGERAAPVSARTDAPCQPAACESASSSIGPKPP